MTRKTDFLYARPSFMEGAARVVDIGGTLDVYNESPNGKIADARAMASDWAVVGADIESSIDKYDQEKK